LDFNAYEEMLAGKRDAGNLHVRFDEGEQRGRRKPSVAPYSTDICGLGSHAAGVWPLGLAVVGFALLLGAVL
jgi:hypothetical protein